jgi:tRNA dimethylallyltransferase
VNPQRSVLVITGPTASGKTAVALALSERCPIEIISMDSALVYRGMDIGTAKPTPAERATAPHHLLDVLDPTDAYSAALFAADAARLIEQIRARGNTPVLVGGTLLYLKALADGLDAMPGADLTIRAAIESEASVVGWPALHDQLLAVDASTAERLNPNDAQRISRALEVWRSTGRSLSSFHTANKTPAQAVTVVSLEPSNRATLHTRIEQRFVAMLANGFLDEVRNLRRNPALHPDLPSMRCVGYRQAWAFLDGACDELTFIQQAQAASRQLAKRQLTWLRSNPTRQIVACDSQHATADALARCLKALSHPC